MADIDGTCDEQFIGVRDELARNIDAGKELGASIAITIDGELVADLWGGWTDVEHSSRWNRDTITNVWSCSKTVTALAALMLVDRGLLDLHAPVARYWPEFAANGKEHIEVRHLLSHTSGLAGWDRPFSIEDMYDRERATARLAQQSPWWEPGSASGYHALTYGHLIGEVLRRTDGRNLATFIADEIAGPLDADFQLGLRRSDYTRVANVIAPPPLPFDLVSLDQDNIAVKTYTSPPADATASWTDGWRAAEIGAANGHSNARALAQIQSVIACGGEVGGVRLLSEATISEIFHEQSAGVDKVLGVPIRFGVGFALPTPDSVPFVPKGRICFWNGWGGSQVVIDTDRRMVVAYTMNRMGPGLLWSKRSADYVSAAFAAAD